MSDGDRVGAIGLLTARASALLGPIFRRAYPVDEVPCFGELLRAIDEADRASGMLRSTPDGEPGGSATAPRSGAWPDGSRSQD